MENYKGNKKCDICNSDSTCVCFICLSYFCESCFKFIHDKEKNSSHKKETIDPYITYNFKCRTHQLSQITLYCVDEKGKLL